MEKRPGSSRQEILRLLRRRGGLTAEDLARAVGITAVAVRQHLQVLEAAGLVGSASERRPIGRPRRVYSLTDQADELFPTGYHLLANIILEQLRARDGRAG